MATNVDMGGNNLIVESVSVGATGPGQSGTLLSGTELTFLDSVTAGTAAASKAVVLDSGTKVSGIKNITYAAGTATVAPQVYTTGTSLTTAAAGSVEFDGTVFYDTAAASSRQVRDTEQYCILTANYTATDSASAQKVFNSSTNGAITLVAGTTYAFEEQILLTNTGTTSHTWATLFGGTASFTRISYSVRGHTSTGNALTAVSEIYATAATATVATAASTSATENVVLYLRGTMTVNAAGTVIPQFQASAQPGLSGTPGITVLAGSFFRCWPLGLAATATVGNWS